MEKWEPPIREEVIQILREQGRNQRDAASLTIEEYVWDPQARAFSGLVVTTWVLMNLPRIAAIHATLSYQARGKATAHHDTVQDIWSSFVLALWTSVWHGALLPVFSGLLICLLWVINPPVVLITGTASLFLVKNWSKSRLPWRPLRPANFIMSRVIGDAYVWLASPLGRLLARGSGGRLIAGFLAKLDELYEDNSRVIIIAHSQGAAIAVAALKRAGKLRKPTHLVTVGGGHRLLQAVRDSQLGVSTSWLSALYASMGGFILLGVAAFQLYYILFLAFWFAFTPAQALLLILPPDWGGLTSDRLSWPLLLSEFCGQFAGLVAKLTVVLAATCLIAVTLATTKPGRPRLLQDIVLPCQWTEIWSRFDPVCIGPPMKGANASGSIAHAYHPKVTPLAVETWILKRNNPLREHNSYFTPGSSSVRTIAATISRQLNSGVVSIALPAEPRIVRRGRKWIRVFNGVIIVILLWGGLLGALVVYLIVR